MSELEERLNAVLSDPQAMSQVMQLAQSLNLGGAPAPQAAPLPPPESQAPPPPPSGGGMDLLGSLGGLGGLGDLSGLGDLLGQIDPKMIARLMPLVKELTSQDGGADQRLQLLYALRPFLKPERRDKVEQAVKAARLLHAGKKLLTAIGGSYV